MKNYLKRPEDVLSALRSLRNSGLHVGLPSQTAAGEMIFQLGDCTLTVAQILELLDKNELDREGIRRLGETQKTGAPELACAVREKL